MNSFEASNDSPLDSIWEQFATALQLKKDDEGGEVPLASLNNTDDLMMVDEQCRCGDTDGTDGTSPGHFINGFFTCTRCGVARDVQIDSGAEWRSAQHFSSGTARAPAKGNSMIRCGDPANVLMPGTQLNTYIGKGGSARQQRVHQWYNVSVKERNLHKIYTEFQQVASTTTICNDTVMCATELYRRLQDEMDNRNTGTKRCNVRQGLKAACLYYACKRLHTPHERKDIAAMFDCTSKIVTRGCNTFLDVMGDEFVYMDPVKPSDFATRFCNLLGISYPDELQIVKLLKAVAALDVMADNTPTSIAAGCIYFFSVEHNLGLNKVTIRDKCGTSPAIVTKVYSKLRNIRELLPYPTI